MESHFMDHNTWQILSQPLMSLIYSVNSKSHSRALWGKSTHRWGSLGVIQAQLPWISQNTMLEWVYQCYDLSPLQRVGSTQFSLVLHLGQYWKSSANLSFLLCAWTVPPTLPSSSPARCDGRVILFSLHERNGLFSTDHLFSSHFLPVHTNGQFSVSEIRLVRYNWCIRLRLNNKYILMCTYHETITTVHRFIILNILLYFCSHAGFSLALSQENH